MREELKPCFVCLYPISLNGNDYICSNTYDCGLVIKLFSTNYFVFWFVDSMSEARGICHRVCSLQSLPKL